MPFLTKIKAITLAFLFTTAYSLEPIKKLEDVDIFKKIVQLLSNKPPPARRSASLEKLNKAKVFFKELTKNLNSKQIKQLLRNDDDGLTTGNKQGEKVDMLAESELKNSLAAKKSALLDRPYVEHAGKNDFLVMSPDILDPFVTVIPNAIYTNVEKKCVNWLDDCSLKGMRERLLRGVRSPFK